MLTQWLAYCGDVFWRSAAAMDTLRQRAANMSAHEAAGMPPCCISRPRKSQTPTRSRLPATTACCESPAAAPTRWSATFGQGAAPVVVVDPRAGHGPGIGGFRRDSEVGMALREGHPVYFVAFDREPVEGQTMGAVVESIARFIEIVSQSTSARSPSSMAIARAAGR